MTRREALASARAVKNFLSHSARVAPPNSSRRNVNRVWVEPRKQKRSDEFDPEPRDGEPPRKRRFLRRDTHTGDAEHPSGFYFTERGQPGLPTATGSFSLRLQTTEREANAGPIREPAQQAVQEFLFTPNGPTVAGERFAQHLARARVLVEPPLGVGKPRTEESDRGTRTHGLLSPAVDRGQLVAHAAGAQPEDDHVAQREPVPGQEPEAPAGTEVGYNVRQDVLRGPLKALRAHLRNLETMQDIRPQARIKHLNDLLTEATNDTQRNALRLAIRRARAASKKAKYPVFFKIDGLVRLAFSDSGIALRDRLVIQLRLTTLMRSVDLQNLVWGLFVQEGKFYLRTTSKTGKPLVFSVEGETLESCKRYLEQHRHYPNERFLRHEKLPWASLGSERIAKLALNIMQQAGIDTRAFKAHALRGAAATHLLKKGVPREWVQARGGWDSARTLDMYYSRIHQTCNGRTHSAASEQQRHKGKLRKSGNLHRVPRSRCTPVRSRLRKA